MVLVYHFDIVFLTKHACLNHWQEKQVEIQSNCIEIACPISAIAFETLVSIEKAKPYNNSPILPNNTTVKKKLEIVIMMHILTSFFLKKSIFIQYWYPIFQFNISKYIQSF